MHLTSIYSVAMFGLLISFSGCQKPLPAQNSDFRQNCYQDRKVMDKLNDQKGIIQKWEELWLIVSEDGTQKWQPCELPREFQMEKTMVVFSADVMQIYPAERRVASPIHLRAIKKK